MAGEWGGGRRQLGNDGGVGRDCGRCWRGICRRWWRRCGWCWRRLRIEALGRRGGRWAGVAVELAPRHRGDGTMAGLMTFSSFSSLGDVAQRAVPFLPVKLLLKHRFLSADKLKELALPYFAGHGRADRVVAFENLGKLTAAYAGDAGNVVRFESGSDHTEGLFS
jgi:hypothetical protein